MSFYGSYPVEGGAGGGVTSLNGETGAVTLVAGTGITITPAGQNITIATTALSSAITSINSDTTAAQTLSVGTSGTDFAIVDAGSGSHVFNLPTASAANRGALSSADWSTFNSKQAALTIGNLTDAGTDGIVVTGGTGAVIGSGTSIAQHVADSTHNGYLSSTDWTTFNNKGSGTVTAVSVVSTNGFAGNSSGGATPALTLSTTITGVLKGNGTAISAATAGTDYSAGTSALATGILKSTTTTGALTIAVAGDFPTLNQNTSGSAASLSATLIVGQGGTGQTTLAAHGVVIGNGSSAVNVTGAGTAGQVLTSNGASADPTFQAVTATAPNSQITYDTGNGFGSTNTNVRRFTNQRVSTGTDLTYANSATLGSSVTVNTTGIYSIMYQDAYGAAGQFAIMVNNTVPTTNPGSQTLTYAQGLRVYGFNASGNIGACNITLHLTATDVITFMAQVSGITDSGAANMISVCRVA